MLDPGRVPGLSNAPCPATARTAPKKAVITAIDFCSMLVVVELFAMKGKLTPCICLFVSPQKCSPLRLPSLGGSNRTQRGFFSLLFRGMVWTAVGGTGEGV